MQAKQKWAKLSRERGRIHFRKVSKKKRQQKLLHPYTDVLQSANACIFFLLRKTSWRDGRGIPNGKPQRVRRHEEKAKLTRTCQCVEVFQGNLRFRLGKEDSIKFRTHGIHSGLAYFPFCHHISSPHPPVCLEVLGKRIYLKRLFLTLWLYNKYYEDWVGFAKFCLLKLSFTSELLPYLYCTDWLGKRNQFSLKTTWFDWVVRWRHRLRLRGGHKV